MPVVLDPDSKAVYQAFLDAKRPPYENGTPAQAREMYLAARFASNPEPPELESAKDISIPAPHGAIPARIYTPKQLRKTNGLAPCLVFLHGGGFVIGNLDSHDVVCRKLAHEGELIVISVDYRLAPEHQFPAAPEDAIAATKWVAANAEATRRRRRAHHGRRRQRRRQSRRRHSHCAARKRAKLAGQLLIYPCTDFRMNHPSHSEPATSILLTHSVIKWFIDHYMGNADRNDWRASPARSKLEGLPPAYVLVAGADPLRDEGNEYAERLKAAGVPVTYRYFPGQFHGFFTMGKLLNQANIAASEISAWLKAQG